jgi:hypothetical protein
MVVLTKECLCKYKLLFPLLIWLDTLEMAK